MCIYRRVYVSSEECMYACMYAYICDTHNPVHTHMYICTYIRVSTYVYIHFLQAYTRGLLDMRLQISAKETFLWGSFLQQPVCMWICIYMYECVYICVFACILCAYVDLVYVYVRIICMCKEHARTYTHRD